MGVPEHKLTREQIHQIAGDLDGTCKSFQDALPEGIAEDELTPADHVDIDETIRCCDEGCGWWSDAGEFDEDGLCQQCQKEHNE